MLCRTVCVAAFIAIVPSPSPAAAGDSFKTGASVGLPGYATTGERAWRDGLLAAKALNASGGMPERKIRTIIEDHPSEPQKAAIGYPASNFTAALLSSSIAGERQN